MITTEKKQNYHALVCIFSPILGCSIIDLDNFLVALLDLTAIRWYEWMNVENSTNLPKRNNRTIEDHDLGAKCYFYTRFKAERVTWK